MRIDGFGVGFTDGFDGFVVGSRDGFDGFVVGERGVQRITPSARRLLVGKAFE
jgi:hypothetical protein